MGVITEMEDIPCSSHHISNNPHTKKYVGSAYINLAHLKKNYI